MGGTPIPPKLRKFGISAKNSGFLPTGEAAKNRDFCQKAGFFGKESGFLQPEAVLSGKRNLLILLGGS